MADNSAKQEHPIISVFAVVGAMGSFFAALNTIQSQLGLGVPITALFIGLIVSGFLVYRNQINLDLAAITWLGTGFAIIVIYLIASQPATVTGFVLRNDGNSVSGITLILTNSSGVEQRVVTDQEGRFEVPNVPDGRYTITSNGTLLYAGTVQSGWQRLLSPSEELGSLPLQDTQTLPPLITQTNTALPVASETNAVTLTLTPTVTDIVLTETPSLTLSSTATGTIAPTDTQTTIEVTPTIIPTELSQRDRLLLTQTANASVSNADSELLSQISVDNAPLIVEIYDSLLAHTSTVRSLEFSPDGSLFASSSSDFSAIVWNTERFESRFNTGATYTNWVNDVAFSPDGENLVTVGQDGRAIVWEIDTELQIAEINTSPIRSVDYNFDGTLLAFGLESGVIEIWDAENSVLLLSLEGHSERVLDVEFDSSGTLLVSGGVDGTIRIWNVLSESEIQNLSSSNDLQILAVTFSSNGEFIASASSSGVVRVWNTVSGERLSTFSGAINWDLTFFANDELMAFGNDNGLIYIWDWRSDNILVELAGHSGAVRSISVHPDGNLILSGGEEGDNSIRIWGIRE